MSMTLAKDSGTITTTTAEQTIKNDTQSGIYELTLNLVNMANGDQFEIRIYKKILTGDGQLYLVLLDIPANKHGDGAGVGSSAAGEVVWRSGPITSPYSITATIKKVAGTNRDVFWVWDQIA